MSSNKFPDVQKASQMLRTSPINKLDLVSEVRKDVKQSIFNQTKNNFDYYDVKNDYALPKKRLPQNVPQSYKSVHRISDSKVRKQIADSFKESEYSLLEKQALREIRQDHGRNVLMSDVYNELSKENDTTPRAQRAKSTKAMTQAYRESISKEVEDLDRWTQEKIHNIKLVQHSEVAELKKEVNRMLFFMEEEGVTMSDRRAVESILEEIDASQKKNTLFGGSLSVLKSEAKTFGDTPKGFVMSKTLKSLNSLPRIQNKAREQESVDYMSQESNSMADSFYGANSKMPLKHRLSHYKGLHEPIEQKLGKHIGGIEGDLERRMQVIGKLTSQNEQLNKRASQLVEYIDALGDKMDRLMEREEEDEEYWAQMPSSIAKEEKKKKQEKERKEKEMLKNFKEELGKCRRQIEANETEIKRNENECVALRKKKSVFLRIKIKLYQKILKQGLDSREEGLVWVLKDLLKEGENITYDDFPAFLDNASRAHLMQKGRYLNRLSDLKGSERGLIMSFKKCSEGNLYLNRSPRAQGEMSVSMTNVSKTPTARERKARTLNEMDTFQSAYYSRLDSNTSLNEIEMEGELENLNTQESFEGRPGHYRATSMSEQKMKSISLAFIPEDREEEHESPQLKTTKRGMTTNFSKLMSLNEIKGSKNNMNESVYFETRSIMGQVSREKTALARSQTIKAKEEGNGHVENSTVGNKAANKGEILAKIHEIQSEIGVTMQKIHEEDQKEGLRIVKEYDPKKNKMDLEFYLASVLGTAQADRFFKRFALKNQM